MKLSHISPEFIYTPVNGTLSMKEKKSFFGSKLVKFDANVSVLNENIIWYQNENGEQLNLNAGSFIRAAYI
jgi:hypothetical protein